MLVVACLWIRLLGGLLGLLVFGEWDVLGCCLPDIAWMVDCRLQFAEAGNAIIVCVGRMSGIDLVNFEGD